LNLVVETRLRLTLLEGLGEVGMLLDLLLALSADRQPTLYLNVDASGAESIGAAQVVYRRQGV
jgi:hypothetical protein